MLIKLTANNESFKALEKIEKTNLSYLNKVYLNSSDCNSKTKPL